MKPLVYLVCMVALVAQVILLLISEIMNLSHATSCIFIGLRQDADDMCMICFTEALWPIPSIQLECGHVFHYNCCSKILEKRWSGKILCNF